MLILPTRPPPQPSDTRAPDRCMSEHSIRGVRCSHRAKQGYVALQTRFVEFWVEDGRR
jgi:hypothetical protein